MINVDNYLNRTLALIEKDVLDNYLWDKDLYKDLEDERWSVILAYIQGKFNALLKFCNSKVLDEGGGHFNAEPSRELIKLLDFYRQAMTVSKETAYSFELKDSYKEALGILEPNLLESGGSFIPLEYKKLNIEKYNKIIEFKEVLEIKGLGQSLKVSSKVIGGGSYAIVSKYKDPFYNVDIVIKKALKTLTEKELERFKKEFNIMRELNSPYIANVYHYDESKNQFYMEHMDYTVYDYIQKHNSKLTLNQRVRLVNQMFSGLKYVHSKGIFHRDISLKNVMLKEYDDKSIVLKIIDFGYYKDPESSLTRPDTEFGGSLNDPVLSTIGMANYSLTHEIYALTKFTLFVMTGKTNISNVKVQSQREFFNYGTTYVGERAETLDGLYSKFHATIWE